MTAFALGFATFCCGLCICGLWVQGRRLKRLEARLSAQAADATEQAELLLYELIEELETRGDTLRTQLERREESVRSLIASLDRRCSVNPPVPTFAPGAAASNQVETINRVAPGSVQGPKMPKHRPGVIRRLRAEGVQPVDIAHRLRIGVGEVELVLKLAALATDRKSVV